MRRLLSTTFGSLLVLLAAAMLATGCLSNSHIIPRSELQALAQTNPQTRGQRVRVVQGFHSDDEPPPAPRADTGTYVHVGVVTPVRSTSSYSAGRPSAKSSADDAKFWIIVAAAIAVGAAVTEGARYDGWVELHPMHPVHLYGWDGSYTWMPLANITPETAAWARKAMVRPEEGPWHELGRAPLNRRGWTYGMLVGSAEVPEVGGNSRGFTSHIQFGHFFTGQLGLLFDLSMGWAENSFGETISDVRTSAELQLLPLALGRLHGGGFGQIGLGNRLDDTLKGSDRSGSLLSGGGMLQLELTTRLAITARAGVTQIYGKQTSDFTVGLSIY